MNSVPWRLSNNEKDFILAALRLDHRIDGRGPYDTRRLTITFAKQDGAVEVQQGQTRVMAVVTGQLGSPYPDRPTEGSLVVFTEFSPMADPTFEVGRGELAVELGRIIDRGLRESRAVDTESLCVLAGQAVWALRVDIHILDNGGNLVDVANIAALASLLSYRRPDCSIGGHNGREVIVHPPEVREPVSLIVHHLPIAVTFGFFGNGDLQVLDPSLKEEAIMGARLTITVNAQGDICAIQKGGGVGVSAAEIMRCVRIASSKAIEITDHLKKAVEANNLERNMRKIKRHPISSFQNMSSSLDGTQFGADLQDVLGSSMTQVNQREALLEMIKTEDMAESTSSGSEEYEEDDPSERIEDKKQKVEGQEGMRSLSYRNRVPDVQTQLSMREGPFGGGPSLWDNDYNVNNSWDATQKPFDSNALMEFNQVAGMMTNASVQPRIDTADLSFEPACLGGMSAAAVYANIPGQITDMSRPLGPIFPTLEPDASSEFNTLNVLSGVELKPGPTSLLDAVKRKRKKGKNQ